MRAAIYARYSTDLQSTASIADQHRLCESRAAALNVEIVARHGDQAVSGSTPVAQRPGGRALLADALAGRIDTLIVESLDRLSRDQVELERIVRRLEHQQIRIIGVSDGYDSAGAGRKVLRAVRGIVAELYLDDLRAKVHRGLTGKILSGYSAGGRSYGYRTVAEGSGRRMVIDEAEAKWVRWIFERYAVDGWSVRRIAYELNAQAVPAPRSGTWAASCIKGVATQGAGLLLNELYIGRHVWNRRQWVKDPDTGKRQKVDRPRSEWQIRECPELRIIDDALWRAAQERTARPRHRGGPGKGGAVRTLFGGLLRCGHCGGAVTAVDARRYACVAHKERGPTVCPGVHALRTETDRRLLTVVRDELFSAESMAEAQRAITAASSSVLAEQRQARQRTRGRLDELDREIGNLVQSIAAAGHSPALLARLQAAEAERSTLESSADQKTQPAADFSRPRAIAEYRRMTADLMSALQGDRDRARELLGAMLGNIRLVAEGPHVFAELETKEPARLLVAGSLLGMVAETGFCIRKRVQIR